MVELKYFGPSDYEQLINWIDTPELLVQWGGSTFDFPLTEQQLANYIQNANNDHSDKLVYSVIQSETGKVVGHISLGHIDKKNKSARIGKVLIGEKFARGQGTGQLMLKEILKIAFDALHLHRVSLGVFDFNKPAIICYERVGFKKEGLLRHAKKFGDTYWNLWEMSMLENEWLGKK
ncbi:GNAT family N-acetyltransferase [Aquibacillus sp. 3ASR75-11]|uniref:GNAT family N-acetyltransferase n=1 Tax=Terrihalobacillus insolitus TaxID=2950438 RepID=A0A9X3WV82_9BACI|nr:GNAT family protein [Terrihalobacillus insolitus]MDC3413135.1 GNAT family N-acetyltransferase [Terrihalobacillus insolitus]MDC3425193.1 GNAT family N-acetyltransferase [Terrihalobacillus insolitus]